ncbi:TonB-dependent receptor plug domain-containing protein [Cyclobacterium sp.]|uniref:TonB-dependent receptor n=1 Tax=Cyclobacterium sp. TaxID=1966343 RepID=UPI00199546A3|nr:TonB-dependent receptor plug domain-containing protein [Cyclobacterium sp.]MBD3630872.1 TonB-dependent receptor plug domain-containing protein [Cyclobacterium sp.]
MTRNIKILFISAFVFLVLAALSSSERSILEKVATNLSVWKINYAPEKVYLHHDKSYYMAGEVIWLKGYLVQASNHFPSAKSKILYVDLVNDQNIVITKLRLDTDQGKTNGNISIPEDLEEGRYFLLGYTNWMGNFEDMPHYRKEIYIWNPQSETAPTKTTDSSNPDVQFFPEGGNLVAGLTGKVAFKATGADGLGLEVSGELYDDSGSKITDFKSRHEGMGVFELKPLASAQYTAKVNFPDGNSQNIPLPVVSSYGYQMSIQHQEEMILASISSNLEKDEKLLLTGIAQDELIYTASVIVRATKDTVIEIPKSKFPTGITRLTLAKESGEPVSERLVFIDHEDQVRVSIKANQSQFTSRELVALEIVAKDQEGNPLATELSLAVTDDLLAGKNPTEFDIQSYLLLSSEVKGFIASPGYYFNKENQDRQEVLDLLLMTQGWRGFTWEKIIEDDFPLITYDPEIDISITGSLKKDNGEPIANGEALLYLKDKYETFLVTETDEKGKFIFEGFHFRDSIDILVQGSDPRGRTNNVNLSLSNEQYSPGLPDKLPSFSYEKFRGISREKQTPVQPLFLGMETDRGSLELGEVLLEEVVVEGRAEIYKPMTLHRNADAIIEPDQLPVAPSGNILEVLQGRVAGLQIIPDGPFQFRAVIRGQGSPLYLLDGIPVDESMLQSINQFDISRIEILKSPGNVGIYGGRGAGGVIALYTHRGPEELDTAETGDHIKVYRIGGFSKSRQFYSPKYGENQVVDGRDSRSTLYWNPSVKTDEAGKATVSFYTSDRSSLYQVVAEGITEKGKIARSTLNLEVY